jgi:hypothetical protein
VHARESLRVETVMLSEHPHLQGLVLGALLLAASAAAMPAVVHAAQDLVGNAPPTAPVPAGGPAPRPTEKEPVMPMQITVVQKPG